MPSNWVGRAVSRLKPQQRGGTPSATGLPDGFTPRSRLFWGVVAVGLGLVAQFALTGGQPLLGGLGLAIAVNLFVANMRPFLAEIPVSHRDRRLDRTQPGEILEDQARLEPGPPPPRGTSDLRGRVVYVKHYWRELTIAEILSGAMPSLPRDFESTPSTSEAKPDPNHPAPDAGEPAGAPPDQVDIGPVDASERPPAGRD